MSASIFNYISSSLRSVAALFLLLLIAFPMAAQQTTTGASGIVIDAQTGDTLPFVQIYFIRPTSAASVSTGIGTTSGMDGRFSVKNDQGYTTLNFQMMGYKTEMVTLRQGQLRRNLTVRMQPDVYGLQDIVVTPKHRKQKYRRKGNPAVELIKEVIAHKDSANVRQADHYVAATYDRMSLAIDNFNIDFSKKFWKQFLFVRDYIDTTGTSPMLTVSVREDNIDEYYQRKPHREKKYVRAKRIFGLEDQIDAPTIKANVEAMFSDVDIYRDNMEVMLNRFVSPLSSALAVSYYQYYIMDTLLLDGDSCIDLAFVPVNSESYSFTGHLYILNDGSYKLRKYAINVPPHINLNFVSDYSVEQSFRREENGLWAPDRINTFAKFYIVKGKKQKQLFAHQTKIYKSFDFSAPIPDSLFRPMEGKTIVNKEGLRLPTSAWDTLRPEPLTFYESSVKHLADTIFHIPKFNRLIQTVDAFANNFISTTDVNHWRQSKWDIGPISNIISWNMLEGVRLRLGGMTTANLHPNVFMNGYVAYGFQDQRPKGSASLIYSFDKKAYHPFQPLRHYLSLTGSYDVEEPGQSFEALDRDELLMSIPTSSLYVTDPATGRKVWKMKNYQYVAHARLKYMKEWPNHLSIQAVFDFQRNAPAGAMRYDRIVSQSASLSGVDPTVFANLQPFKPTIWPTGLLLAQHVPYYYDYNLQLELRYSPGEVASISKTGKESPFNMDKDAPVIKLDHWIGLLDDRIGKPFFYQRTEITAEKRFWFSSFGHLDARIQTGIIWNKVPFTRLYIPPTSTSIFLALNSFNEMQPMEFLMDQYVALFATYYFKGWILNRIPGINRLKLRGVVSFSGIYGGLTAKNNPYLTGSEGLYLFPQSATYDASNCWTGGQTSSPIGKLPYMEITAGFENIFKFIRIDYVRRLTYNDYMLPDGIHRKKVGAWGRNGVKVTFRFAL